MSVTMPETAVPAATSHPTVCPPWCQNRAEPLSHQFGPTFTTHVSAEVLLETPVPMFDGESVLLRGELFRLDEHAGREETVLSLVGDTETALTRGDVDVLIGNVAGFLAALRVLRSQMDAS